MSKIQIFSTEALDKLLGLVRESYAISDAINDEVAATNTTYSSIKIQELLEANASSSIFSVNGEINLDDETVEIEQTFVDIKAAQLGGQEIRTHFLVKYGETVGLYGFNLLYSTEKAIAFEWVNSTAKIGIQIVITDDNEVTLSVNNFEGGGASEIPVASKDTLGLVTTTSEVAAAQSYHKPCPIVNGVPYYEKMTYSGMLTQGESNYTKDADGTVHIHLPVGNTTNYKIVYNIYLYHMDNIASSNAPCAYSHIVAFPNTLAYPGSTFISYIVHTQSNAGGAMIEEQKYTLGSHSAEQFYLDFTISPSETDNDNWTKNLFYKVVID